MGEKASSFVESVRKALNDAANSGSGLPEELLFVPKDGKKVVRFLNEFDPPGATILMHDKWQVLMPQPCLKQYNETCPFHGSDVRLRTQYAWTVWDYEAKSKKIGLWPATLQSPVERLLDIYDMFNTIRDRDVELSRVGTGTKARWKARPMTPTATPFEGPMDQPYSEEAIMNIVKGMITKRTLEDLEKKEG